MRVLPSVAAIVALSATFTASSFGQINPASLTITNYQLVSETRATITQSYFTYSATLVNVGPALPLGITATATPRIPGVFTIVNGANNLHFPPALHNGQVTSTNTFTVLLDRTQQFYFTQLTWSFNAPVANAGPNQTAAVGSTVNLNASASTNPSGLGTLSYSWALTTVPAGSNATLQNANSVEATFVPDVAGAYIATVTVSNGVGSDYSSATISTTASAPVANAGPNQTVNIGTTVQLDGSKSVDFDGNPLTYAWTLVQVPSGSHTALTGATSVSPTFVPDLPGTYVAQLVVNDGNANSAPSTVTIVTNPMNTPPVANAGPNQVVSIGAVVQLDGSKSTDVNGNALTYTWSLITLPPGSKAALNNASLVNPTFTADLAGTYIAQLIVNDGVADSNPATVTITTSSILAPIANAGQNQTVGIGTIVTLSGSGSDPQSLPLSFHWSLTTKPNNSDASLSSTTIANPTFIADQPGNYVAQLIVNNGTLNSPPATVTITTTVSAPVANAGSAQTVAPGATVTLDGTASTDPQNLALTYSWSLLNVPTGSTAALSSTTAASPTFVADLTGMYVAQLIVNNGFLSSQPVTVTITASAGNELVLSPNPLNLTNAPGNLTVSIGNPAGDGGLVVSLGLYDATVISAPATVTIPKGQMSATVPITPVGPGSTNIFASAPSFRPAQTTVNVSNATVSLSLSANAVAITKTVTGTLTLSGPAPSPVTVMLSANTPGIVSFPATVSIAMGASSNTFTITGVSTGQVTITASATGYTGSTGNVSVAPLGAVILQQGASVGVGQSANFSVSLATAAPAPGVTITLTSGDPTKLTVSPSVFIATGATTPATAAQITGVNFGSTSVTAAATGFTGATATVQVAAVLSFTSNITLAQNSGGSLTLNLSSNAPANGLVVTLQSNNTSAATVPSTVTIPGNANSVNVPVTSVGTGTATITASSVSGVTSGTASVSVIPGLGINTAGIGQGVVGLPYSAAVTATNGSPPYTFIATSLPAGLTISAAGQITGTPTAAGTTTASITVTDSTSPTHLSAKANVSITINSAVSITTSSLASGIVGQAYSATVAATGGLAPLTFSATGLPAGLSINSSGQITGTPTGAGTSTASITVTDSSSPTHSSATKQLSITIIGALSLTTTSLNAGTVNVAYSATIAATGGTSPYTFSATGLPAGLSMSSGGQITGTPTSVGTSSVQVKVADSGSPQQTATATLSLKIAPPILAISTASLTAGTVNVAYNATVSATGGTTPYTFSATGLPAGLSMSSGGQITGTPTSVGTSSVQVKVVDSSNPQQTATATLSLTIAPPQLAISTASLTAGTVNVAYNATISATGGTPSYTFSATNLPAGLSISSTGQITGTPTTAGKSTVAIKVMDSSSPQQTATANLSLTINPPVLAIKTTSLTGGTVGAAYNASVAASGGTPSYTFSATSLPAGLTISSSGQITGTPTAAGTSTVAVKVVDSGNPQQTATANLSLTIVPPPLSITTTSPLTSGTVNVAYSASVAATGGTTPYTFSATSLPAGLSMSAGGLITGTPTAVGSNTVAVKVTDSSNPQLSANANLLLVISPAKLVVTTTSLTGGTVGTAYSASAAASGGTPSYTFSATGLPAGLTISSSGQITGTPTTAGTSSVVITVIDSGNPKQTANSASLSLTIVAPPLSITTTSLTSGTVNTAYSATVAATGGTSPYAFSATGLPAGLTMSGGGQITGTPTGVVTNAQVVVKVTDASSPQQTATKTLSLTISPAPLTITTKSPLPSGTANVAYSATVQATGGTQPYSFSAVGLPTGLSMSTSGQITGAAISPVTNVSVSVIVTDSSNPQMSATTTLSLTIKPAPLQIITTALQGGTAGTKYTATQILTSGGTAPLTFSATGFPTGLGMSSSGLIQGTPQNSGNFTVNLTVVDSSNPQMTATASLLLAIAPAVSSPTLSVTSATVGQGLEVPITITFSPATTVNTILTVSSSNPSAVLLAAKPGSAGSGTLLFNGQQGQQGLIQPGTSSLAIYAQGLTNSGSVTITASADAAGYTSGTSTVTLANSGFVIAGANGNGGAITVNQNSSTSLTVSAVQLDSSNNVVQVEQVSGSAPVTVNLSLGNSSLGALSPSSLSFAGGTDSVTTSFNAGSSAGSTTITAAEPSGFTAPAGSANVLPVTIQAASIIPQNVTVGHGLETTTNATFHGAITSPITSTNPITITSSDASKLLLAVSPTDPGSASIEYTSCTGLNPTCLGLTSTPTFYVYGLVSTGSATYTVNVPGLGSGTGTVTFGPAGFVLSGPFGLGAPSFSTTSESQATTLDVQPALLDSGGNYVAQQAVAGNVSVNVNVISGTTSVGAITTSPLTFTGGINDLSTEFQPIAQGSSTLSVNAPSPFVTPTAFTTVIANVQTPNIGINSGQIVGQNLEEPATIVLGAPAPANMNVTLVVTSGSARLSTTGLDAGSTLITVPVLAGSNTGSFFIYGEASSGTATISASAAGYKTGTDTETLVPSGVVIYGPLGYGTIIPTSTPVNSTLAVTVATVQISAASGNAPQALAGNVGPLTVNLTNSNTAAGTLPGSVTIPVASVNGGSVNFNAGATSGVSTILGVQEPSGYSTPSQSASLTVEVN